MHLPQERASRRMRDLAGQTVDQLNRVFACRIFSVREHTVGCLPGRGRTCRVRPDDKVEARLWKCQMQLAEVAALFPRKEG